MDAKTRELLAAPVSRQNNNQNGRVRISEVGSATRRQDISSYSDLLQDLSLESHTQAEHLSYEAEAEKQLGQRRQPSLGFTVLDKTHDPFLVGGQHITQRQLSLIHTCESSAFRVAHDDSDLFSMDMEHLGPMFFRTSTGSAYFGPNHVTHLCLQHSDAGALWVAIQTEELLQGMAGLPRTRAMELQKADGGRLLLKALANHRQNFQGAYLGLIKASQTSSWFRDTKMQNIHTAATDMLIKSVGGLENAMRLLPDLEPHYITSLFMYTTNWQSMTRDILEQITLRFLTSVEAILNQYKPGSRGPFRGSISDLLAPEALPPGYTLLEHETIRLLEKFTALTISHSVTSRKFRLGLLVQMCSIFIDFSSMTTVIAEVLRNLIQFSNKAFKLATVSSEEGLSLDDGPIIAVTGLVGHIKRQVLTRYMPGQRFQLEFRTTETIVDGARLFDFLSPHSQDWILRKLYAWFSNAADEARPFTVHEMNALAMEVRNTWRLRQKRAS